MVSRLELMHNGEQFTFLCAPKMAEGMDSPIARAYGTIVEQDIRSFGVIITVKKDDTPG